MQIELTTVVVHRLSQTAMLSSSPQTFTNPSSYLLEHAGWSDGSTVASRTVVQIPATHAGWNDGTTLFYRTVVQTPAWVYCGYTYF